MLYQPIWLYALCDLYMLLKTYTGHILYHLWLYDCVYVHIGIILYQPIWLCALCDLYWEQVHAAKTYTGHILYHLWLYDCVYVHRDHIISVHLAVCIM